MNPDESFENARPVAVARDEPPDEAANVVPMPTPVAPRSTHTRQMPASEEAELHVIACCILDGEDKDEKGNWAYPSLARAESEGLSSASFFWPQNQIIFGRLSAMKKAGLGIGMDTLAQELVAAKEMDPVGGFAYLMQVTGRIPTTAHAGYFIQVVKEKADRRRLIRDLTSGVEQAYADADIGELLQTTKARVEAIQTGSAVVKQADALKEILGRRVQACSPPPEPVTRLWLADKPIATGGNIQTMTAKSKAGKTVATGAAVAAVVCATQADAADNDTFKFRASNPQGHAVIVIDTEQSPFDAWTCYQRVLKRAGEVKDPPWLLHFALVGYSVAKRKQALTLILEHARKTFGGVFLVILDGVAHFVSSVNDLEESNALADWLRELTVNYDCPILCVIHSNEGDKAGDDSRGHLGKQLMRDAESNLLLKKVGNVTTITSEKQRKAPITEQDGIAFQWSDEFQMHVSCDSISSAKEAVKSSELRDLANEVFGNESSMKWANLKNGIMGARECSTNTADRKIAEMRRLGVIKTTFCGMYQRVV